MKKRKTSIKNKMFTIHYCPVVRHFVAKTKNPRPNGALNFIDDEYNSSYEKNKLHNQGCKY
jgi:hypothetical protein